MRILVTGGAGFLGSHLCDRLLDAGHEVVALDNLKTSSRRNIAHLAGLGRFSLVEQSVTERYEGSFDQIYNLACPASPEHYQRDPLDTFRTSVVGADNLLDLASRTGARYFQASTSEVYGDPLVHPQVESYCGNVSTIGPRACYDEGKRAAETLCFDYRRMRGTDIKVVRIFNTYGPRMNPQDGRVVSNFIVKALRGDPLTVYGDGTQTRSFCYVDDLIEGFIRMMNSPRGVTGPVNLGNTGEFTIRELADIIINMTDSKSGILELPLPEDDPRQRKPDITLAGKLLDWSPKVPLREGLARTIAFFEQQLRLSAEPAIGSSHKPLDRAVTMQ